MNAANVTVLNYVGRAYYRVVYAYNIKTFIDEIRPIANTSEKVSKQQISM